MVERRHPLAQPLFTRAENSHRSYTPDDVYRIVFVTRLRATGMPIAEVKRYVDLSRDGDTTLKERLDLLEAHRQAVEQQIQQLYQHLERISDKIAHYRETHERQLAQLREEPT